jgi:hypothetical protein
LKDGDNGLLVPAASAAELGERLSRALGDGTLRASAAEQNLAVIRRDHDWALNMRKMEAEYVEIVQARRAPSRMGFDAARS